MLNSVLKFTINAFIALTSLIFSVVNSFAQPLQVNAAAPYNTAVGAGDVLLGNGVTATNFTFYGNPIQMGLFFDGTSSIGLDSGIVLSSGDVLDLPLPGFGGGGFINAGAAPGTEGYWGTADMGVAGNNDLFNVANSVPALIGQVFVVGSAQDAAVLEFDFVPTDDTVQFRYVFGSNEYLTWINSMFNDVFGFFVSGPGITGPFTSPAGFPNGSINIANVPGSVPQLPITISSVQPALNQQYYIDNPMNTDVAMNGYTVVLTATMVVVPCETYHIRLAIADGSDSALDSWVFLEANSFSSTAISVTSEPSYPSGIGGDSTLFEGCGSIDINFERFDFLADTFTINYILTGTATNGVDFASLPDSIVFLPGQSIYNLTIEALDDNLTEGFETIELEVDVDIATCGVSDSSSSITIYINDPYPVEILVEDDTLDYHFICDIDLGVQVLSGLPGFTYNWSTGETTDTINVNPISPQRYSVTVTDTCGVNYAVDSISLVVIRDPVEVIAKDTSVNCPNDPAKIKLFLSGGNPPYDIVWDNGATDTTQQNLFAFTTTTFQITVTDECAVDTTIVNPTVFVPEPPPLLAQLSTDTLTVTCPGEMVAAVGRAIGGFGQYQMTWDNWASLNTTTIVYPEVTTTYFFDVQDYCQATTVTAPFHVIVPDFDSLTLDIYYEDHMCLGDSAQILTFIQGGASQYTYEWNNFAGNNDTIIVSPVNDVTTYSIEVTDMCDNVVTNEAVIFIDMPTADYDFLFQGSNLVEFTDNSTENVDTYLYSFSSGDKISEADFSYTFHESGLEKVQLLVTTDYGCQDSITKVLIPPFQLWVPNSFSPNEDGKNDVLYAEGIGFIPGTFKMWIYNRWGNLIKIIEDPTHGWDGGGKSGDEIGSYVYRVEVQGYGKNGFITDFVSMGTITLIR